MGRECGSDDVWEGGSGSEGGWSVVEENECGRNVGMDEASERGEGGSARRSEGAREDRGRKGDMEGEKLQAGYHDEDTDQYTVDSAQNNTQRSPCHCDFGITNTKL